MILFAALSPVADFALGCVIMAAIFYVVGQK